jgi:hypothetical protein
MVVREKKKRPTERTDTTEEERGQQESSQTRLKSADGKSGGGLSVSNPQTPDTQGGEFRKKRRQYSRGEDGLS